MTFLQPAILFGLPLLAVPVLVHLLNRLRYRTVEWPTLMFLLAASKQATRQARVREWLILACRLLAVLALLLFLARPRVGGWLGWAAGNRPDTVLVLLDRSPSMETADPQTHLSKRALALRRLAEAAGAGGAGRYVLFDSATRRPQEFASPAALPDLAAAGVSDAAADIPALLAAALDYLEANPTGRSEIWLCSDLQQANWQPRAPGWETVRARFARLPAPVPVRLLALTGGAQDNLAVRVTEVLRRRTGKGSELEVTVEIFGQAPTPKLPLTLVHEGARSQMEVNYGGQQLTTTCRLDLGPRRTAGWGWIELPPDANPRDNQAFFVYPEDRCATALVVTDAAPAGRSLRRAAAPAPELLNQAAAVQTTTAPLRLADVALLLWQAPPPSDAAEKIVTDFVADGGVALYLPPTPAEAGAFRVTTWRNTDGPLARTQDGKDLPLPELTVAKRAPLAGDGSVLALFDDGKPFLTRQPLGQGAVYRLATLPVPEWSSLGEGRVLVPLVQRLLQEGARRLGQVATADVGDPRFATAERLAPVAGDQTTTAVPAASTTVGAGIYRQESRLVALNRPAAEDESERLDNAAVRETFGTISYRLFAETGTAGTAAPAEVWRWFVLAMLVLLAAEGFLILPGLAGGRWTVPGQRPAFGQQSPAGGGAP